MLEVAHVSKQYATPRGPLTVLSDVSVSLAPGQAAASLPSGRERARDRGAAPATCCHARGNAAALPSSDIPASTPESDQLSRDLRQRGFRFVGSTIVYAFMQAVGLVSDHMADCFLTERRFRPGR